MWWVFLLTPEAYFADYNSNLMRESLMMMQLSWASLESSAQQIFKFLMKYLRKLCEACISNKQCITIISLHFLHNILHNMVLWFLMNHQPLWVLIHSQIQIFLTLCMLQGSISIILVSHNNRFNLFTWLPQKVKNLSTKQWTWRHSWDTTWDSMKK